MSLLRHTVLLRFKPDATEDQIQAVLKGLATMPEKMDFIRRYEFGLDVGILEGNPSWPWSPTSTQPRTGIPIRNTPITRR